MKQNCHKNLWVLLVGIFVFQSYQSTANALTCEAFYTYEEYDGSTPVTGGITFFNQATGNYTDLSWDFGDGNISNVTADSLDHFYASDGVYNVCLTIWDDQGCLSTFCSDVIVGDLSDICQLTDCVFPGDANTDGEANFYDLLEIGVGNGVTGPVRPNATIEFVGQLGPDWQQTTANGINFKHLDCDGNGIIDENDNLAITTNYQVMDLPNPTSEAGAPLIHIEFDVDTIFVDDMMLLEDFPIQARLKVGNQDFPAEDIYGLALYLSYPSDLVIEDSVYFAYQNNSFFGASSDVIWLPNNLHEDEQVDIGVTRLDGFPVSGFGEVGEGTFIVSSDILDGRIDDGIVHFPLSVNGVRMVDENGLDLPINLANTPATLVFKKVETTSSSNLYLDQKIELFPNPATEKVVVDIADLNGVQMEVFNDFGQRLIQKTIQNQQTEIHTQSWSTGVYFVKIQTEEGVVSKRFVIK